MTGAPEAALARELRMCLAAIALVTDMDAGAEPEQGVQQQDVFALFAQQHRAAQGAARRRPRRPARPGRLHLRHLGRRPRPDLRDPVKVLLTGSAGFIGSAIDRPLAASRRRGGAGRPDAPGGPRRDRRRRRAPHRSTSATPAPGSTCSAASTWSATRPRWSGMGAHVADLPSYASHNDLGTAALLAAMHEAGGRPAGARLVDGGLRRGPLRLRRARPAGARAARPRRALRRRAASTTTCPVCGEPLGLDAGRRGRAARPAQRLRRQQGRPGALRLRVGAAGRSRGGRRCATTTSTARGCRGTRRTPASRRCSAPRWSAARRRGCSRTAARCATSCTSTTSRGPTCWR